MAASQAELDPHVAGYQRLTRYLAAAGIAAHIVQPGVPMPTVPLAAAAIGVAPERIIKSVLFTGGETRVLAIACGVGRIDRHRLADLLGVPKLKLADAATVFAVTGFPAGGVAPVGHATPVPVVIDERVMELDEVYGGAGSEDALLAIAPAEIRRLTGASVADIAERG